MSLRHHATPDVRSEYQHVRMDDGAILAGGVGSAGYLHR
jgi:hypothetical protein